MSVDVAAQAFHESLLRQILEGGHLRFGDALLAFQRDYAERGSFLEPLAIYALFGDPALGELTRPWRSPFELLLYEPQAGREIDDAVIGRDSVWLGNWSRERAPS